MEGLSRLGPELRCGAEEQKDMVYVKAKIGEVGCKQRGTGVILHSLITTATSLKYPERWPCRILFLCESRD